jgi:hypothetical protein
MAIRSTGTPNIRTAKISNMGNEKAVSMQMPFDERGGVVKTTHPLRTPIGSDQVNTLE